jgi:Tfp pilus assembly protein PilE
MMKINLRANHTTGFTWIEFLVVVFIIGLLCAVLLPSFLNTAHKDGPRYGAGRSIGKSTYQQVEYFRTNGSFSKDPLGLNKEDNPLLAGNLNYQFEIRSKQDSVLHNAKARYLKAKVVQTIGPFSWNQDSPQLLYGYVAAVVVRRSNNKKESIVKLETINCMSMTSGNIILEDPIDTNAVLSCGKGTRRVGGDIYDVKNP